ncbi:hypothetical protein ACFQU7_07880 [Pseudoroseomonas wenyumeiae]
MEALNADTDEARARLHELLERQHFRLSHWKLASEEINWRRFFDVTSLGGVRIEVPEVFEESHALILRLYAEGLIDGLRIDHVDGLAQPGAYCRKLRRRMAAAARLRPADAPKVEPYIVVEKILAPGESMPIDWQVDGTTGYEFMDQVSAVLHDPEGKHRSPCCGRKSPAARGTSRPRNAWPAARSCATTWPPSGRPAPAPCTASRARTS